MDEIKQGDLVTVKLGNNVLAKKAEVVMVPVWEDDLWVLKDLSDGTLLQVSAIRATIVKLL